MGSVLTIVQAVQRTILKRITDEVNAIDEMHISATECNIISIFNAAVLLICCPFPSIVCVNEAKTGCEMDYLFL